MKQKLRSLLKFALPYILTALIPLTSVFFLSSATVEAYRSRLLEDRIESTESAFGRFCARLYTIETNTNQIAINKISSQYAYDSIQGRNHTAYDNYEFQKLLGDYWMIEDASTVFFFDPINNTVVSSDVALSNALDFFKYYYKVSGLTPEQAIEKMKTSVSNTGYTPATEITVDNAVLQIVEYRMPVPANVGAIHGCQLVVAIRVDRVFGDVLDVMAPEGECYFYSDKGDLIYSSGTRYRALAQEVDSTGSCFHEGKELNTMVFTSADRKWTLKVISPQTPMNNIPAYIGILVGFSLVASTVLTVYFTVKNLRQLREVLELFTGKKAEIPESGFGQIKLHAEKLLSDNSRYREEMARYAGSRRYHLTDMLLRGTYENEETILSDMEREGLRIPAGTKAVLCVQYGQGGKQQQTLIREALSQLGQPQRPVFQTALGESVCILSMDSGEAGEMASRLEAALSEILETSVQVASGAAVEALRELSVAYSQGKTVLRYREITGRPVHLYSQVSDLENEYFCPENLEEKIQNLLLGGQEKEARELIQRIKESNFGPGAPMLSFRAIERLRAELRDLLLTLADRYDVPVEDEILQAESSGSIPAFFEMVYVCLDKLTEQMDGRNRSSSQLLADRIREYVDEAFCQPEISLAQIAQRLDIHEKYVSRVFKAGFGENLSAYVERKRIEKACELLRSTTMLVADIAEAVGYSSDLSFRRAFKKVKDLSPAAYRNNQLGK